jgi:hypothetical protein
MTLRNLVICSLFVLSASYATAQYNTKSEWYLGPTAGATASTVTLVPKMVDKFYTLGRNGGISVRYISEANFGLQVELKYSESGWKEDYYQSKIWSQYTYSRKLRFIEIPILSHLYTTTGAASFFLNLGADFQYLLSESEENKSPTSMWQHGKLVETPLQYGILGGAGLEFKIGRAVVGLEGRYCYNLSNLFNDAVGNDFVNSNLQVISLNLNLMMQLSGVKKK